MVRDAELVVADVGLLISGIGYIGARLAEMLLDSGETVVGLDNLFSTDIGAIRRLALRPGFLFVEGDVADEHAVRRAFETGIPIDTVFHLAAQSSARADAAPTHYTEETNLVGPRVVLEQSCAAGVSTFVYSSSLQIYGRKIAGLVDETRPFGPLLDMNHLSKVYVEKLMEMFAHNLGIRSVAARIGLVYGLSPVMKTDPRFMTAPNKFCRQAAFGETLRVDASGFQPTSLIHVDDVCRGLIFLAKWPTPGFSVVNLIGETASPAQVAMMVQRAAAKKGLDVKVETTPPESPVGDCSFQSALAAAGFSPMKSLDKDLPTVLEYFINENIFSRSSLQHEEREPTPPLPSEECKPEILGPEHLL